jgi:hypothetical protein
MTTITSANPAAPTRTTPPATEPGAWVREVLEVLDLLGGGALARLRRLAANPPTDAAEVYAALRSIFSKLDLHAELIDLDYAVRQRGEAALHRQSADASGEFARLVGGLLRSADALIDAGQNDPADPLIRLRDFGATREEAKSRLRVLGEPPNANLLAVQVGALPPNHPAHQIEPLPTEYGRCLVLGRDGQELWRLSVVASRTAEALARHRAHEAGLARIKEAEKARKEHEHRQTEAGRAERLRELEAEVKKARKD